MVFWTPAKPAPIEERKKAAKERRKAIIKHLI